MAPRPLLRALGLLGILAATAGTAEDADPVWTYDVTAGPGARELRIEARLEAGAAELTVDRGLGAFIRDPEVEQRGRWIAAERRGDRLAVPSCAHGPCRVRYRFLLEQATAEVHDRGRAFAEEAVFLAPPSSWLAFTMSEGPVSPTWSGCSM